MGFSITQKGDWSQTRHYLEVQRDKDLSSILDKHGQRGVAALRAATPVDQGETAAAWTYQIVKRKGYYSIRWRNTHINGGNVIAVLLQYGHGTKNGGYVQGRDYINPAMQPIFDQIAEEAWKEVTQ
jgi:hypothetical protein